MKKSITFLFALCSILSFAQSILVIQGNNDVTGTTVIEKFILKQTVSTKFKLYNSSDKDKKITATRIIKSTPRPDYYITPIFGYSEFGPITDSVYIIPDTIEIKAKSYFPIVSPDAPGLAVDFHAENECKEYFISFILWGVEGNTDSSEVTIHYTCANGINEIHSKENISNVYPNPVRLSAFFDYQIQTSFKQARIVLLDILGKQVKELPIVNREGHVAMNTDHLPRGIYTYQFIVDDYAVDSRKLIIQSSY